MKLNPQAIPFLPEPRPMFEIFVCSPTRRRGPPACGTRCTWRAALERSARGLPNRDPRPRQGADGEERGHRPGRSEGRFRHQAGRRADRPIATRSGRKASTAIAGSSARCSTSPTTSTVRRVVHPPDCVIYDADDPYLVVAADKGTATFSDIANESGDRRRLLARRRVRFRRQQRVRPQGDGHHRSRRLGERASPRSGDRQGRRRRRPHRGRRRRHVG